MTDPTMPHKSNGLDIQSVSIVSPEERDDAAVSPSKKYAGGIPAVLVSSQFSLTEMGVRRSAATWLHLNQKTGFDCPGCAWPDPDSHRSRFEFCENGIKAISEEATLKRVTPEFFQKYSVQELSHQSDYWLGKQGRITNPMWLAPGSSHYQPIDWNDAFKLVAAELNSLSSPNEAMFYTSGRTSNEAAFLYQLFVRQFGTNNLPDCSNMCHESSGAALSETIGVGKGTVLLDDFYHAQAIFIFGQNPGTNHPRMMTALALAQKNGCKIVAINPLPEPGLLRFEHPQQPLSIATGGTPIASLYLQVKINGDAALAIGLQKVLLELEEASPGTVINQAFIDQHTSGWQQAVTTIKSMSWQDIERLSGLKQPQIREAAEILATSERVIYCWAMGLTQHKQAVATIQQLVNIALMRGHLGKQGAGLCPVRGHSNVQGDRTMGIWEKMSGQFLDALGREFDFSPPTEHGLDTVDAIRYMHSHPNSVFIGMGGNFLSATPDTQMTAQALQQCRLTVHISTKLNRAHLITGNQALILPCLGRTERDVQASGDQFVTVEDSMSMVHASRGTLAPASPFLLSEPAIVAGIAKAVLGSRSAVNWDALIGNYDRIRDHIARVVPGFTDFNMRVKEGPFHLPNAAANLVFRTSDGKAHFTPMHVQEQPLADGELLLMTIRSHDQFNTTIYGLNDRYRGISGGRRVIFMNSADIARRGFKAGDWVDITSHFRGEVRTARQFKVVEYSIPEGCAAAYYPETNVLAALDNVADKSNTPVSKSIVITLQLASPQA